MAIATMLPARIRERYDVWTTREATPEDLNALVNIDIDAFNSVFKEDPRSPEAIRNDLTSQFAGRLAMLDSRWTQIAYKNGSPTSFIMACPTDKPPESFSSWEETTNNGTLEGLHNPSGDFLYVVSLSARRGGENLLMDTLIGHILLSGKTAYFESRVPGLRTWVSRQARARSLDHTDTATVHALATEYFETRKDGKYLDPLLNMYADYGCEILKLVENAYHDPKSLNYGALCIFRGELPYRLHRNPLTRKAAGRALIAVNKLKLVSKHE